MRKMKIVLYTYGLPFTGDSIHTGPLGGAESACIYLAQSLAKLGHEVIVFCICPSPGNYDGVIYKNMVEFDFWLQKGHCDLFICSRYYQIYSKPIPSKLKVLWLHDHILEANATEIKRVLANIDFIYCLSNYHAKYTAQFFTDGQEKIKITSNGVDLSFVQSVTKAAPKQHKMMYTSRPERGLKEALFIYEKIGDKTLAFLACSYPYPNESLAKDYTNRIERLNQQGFNIRFEQFNKRSLYQNIAESKVVIYPSNTPEIFCISAIEAQACKTVFLGRQFGALEEVVGYPCQKDPNPHLFYQATKRVLEDDTFRRSLEQLGWQHIQKYTWEKVAIQFVEDAAQQMSVVHTSPNTPLLLKNQRPCLPNKAAPLITCIMESVGPIIQIKASIYCFIKQSYPNKELYLICSDKHYKQSLQSYLDHIGNPRIKFLNIDTPKQAIKEVFNHQENELLCWWASQDLYHPDYLAYQYNFLKETEAEGCLMRDYLGIDGSGNQLYWITGHEDQALAIAKGGIMADKTNSFRFLANTDLTPDKWIKVLYQSLNLAFLTDLGFTHIKRLPNGETNFPNLNKQNINHLQQKIGLLQTALKHYPLPQPIFVFANKEERLLIYKRG